MPIRLYVLGAVHVLVGGGSLHLLNAAFLAHDQQAIWQMRGAWGEDATRDELGRAKRKRHIWGWVDSVEVGGGDIDHVVVTRRGGVVVIDSKWRNEVTRESIPMMAESARKAARRAEGVMRTVLKRESGARHRQRSDPITVTPVVVLWGAARSGVPADYSANDVLFLNGRRLLGWLAASTGHEVPQESAKELLALLTAYRDTAAASAHSGRGEPVRSASRRTRWAVQPRV